MVGRIVLILVGLYVVGAAVWLAAGGVVGEKAPTELVNVSYDPTRELWKDVKDRFVERYEQEHGVRLTITVTHGGSASQARSVIDGLEADVVTLGLWSDTNAVHKRGLIDAGWDTRLPYGAVPYYSTIVFVVRRGNPKGIRDWPDLVKPGVEVITPNPKTSGNGKLSFLAAWGAELHRTGDEDQARAFVAEMYKRVKVLDTGARAATTTFRNGIGDVYLTWENEAYLAVKESAKGSAGAMEVVYPRASIRAEPPVAVVDANVRKKGTRRAAEAYLKFLYTDEGQDIIARHRYRPSDPAALARHRDKFPDIDLFPITRVAPGWDEADDRFFKAGGEFDQLYLRNTK